MEQADHILSESSGGNPPDEFCPGVPVAVTLWEGGKPRSVPAQAGESLMLALKRAGLPLLAVCGGKGACGTCKVAFAPGWVGKLSPPEKRELRLLTHLKAGAGERLSCRITLSQTLDGLEVGACA